jgi:hypothetical protein
MTSAVESALDSVPKVIMPPNHTPSDFGFPLREGPVKFAVGPPDGLTSNTWRFWTTVNGDIYLACRDNFKEAKV